MRKPIGVALFLLFLPLTLTGQVSIQTTPGSKISVSYTEPSDEPQAERLRELVARVKGAADQLDPLTEIPILIVHSPRELEQRIGPEGEGQLSAVSYVHGILFVSPTTWTRNPTEEALELEMRQALIRYNVLRLAGGNRVPFWLEDGLVSALTQRPFAVPTGEFVAQRAPLLLARFEPEPPEVGYWAVRYLVEARGGLTPVRQLLRLVAQRPGSFVENLQLVYAVPAGELEREWRGWLVNLVEADKRQRQTGVREGPLVKDRPN
ncbi:MAG: hypothetical protein ACRD4U_09450 [Candidatus Acidiferrales bacterium]